MAFGCKLRMSPTPSTGQVKVFSVPLLDLRSVWRSMQPKRHISLLLIKRDPFHLQVAQDRLSSSRAAVWATVPDLKVKPSSGTGSGPYSSPRARLSLSDADKRRNQPDRQRLGPLEDRASETLADQHSSLNQSRRYSHHGCFQRWRVPPFE